MGLHTTQQPQVKYLPLRCLTNKAEPHPKQLACTNAHPAGCLAHQNLPL